MMTATLPHHRALPNATRQLEDLMIHEFDQWDNPSDLDVTFSGVCWVDFAMEPTE